jgi:hypothetical protein
MKAQNQLITCDICKKQITLSINEPMIGGTPYHYFFASQLTYQMFGVY